MIISAKPETNTIPNCLKEVYYQTLNVDEVLAFKSMFLFLSVLFSLFKSALCKNKKRKLKER